MLILGLNAYHGDSAACLVRDGELVAAAEEERFRRMKHWAGLPTQAIDYCLREAGARISDVDHIAINRKPGVNNLRRLGFLLTHRPEPRLVLAKLRNIGKAATVESALRAAYQGQSVRAQVHHVEHHLAHLASAFLVGPFEEAVCLSVDGFGDFASAAWGMGRGSEIQIDDRVYFPHSLGIFYSAITQFIGFPHFGDEYKVMGLAPYGEPKYLPQMREIVRVQGDGTFRLKLRCFRHHSENVSYTWNDCSPEVGTLYRRTEMEALLGPERKKGEALEQKHKDLARSAQAMYEEAFFALLNALHAKYQCSHLALSGGCAMNSVANGKVYLRSPFKRMYLPAAAGDAGGAIGSAFAVWHELEGRAPRVPDITPHSPGPWGGTGPDGSISASQRVSVSGGGRGAGGEVVEVSSSVPPTARSANGHSLRIPHSASRVCLMDAYSGPGFSDAEIESLLCARGLVGTLSNVSISASQPFSVSSASSLRLDSAPEIGNRQSEIVNDRGEVSIREMEGQAPRVPNSQLSTFNSQLSVTHSTDFATLARTTAQAISEGKVIGWFQGRMEWGPRALGNRSILGDPRRADMKDILNLKIKRRESFRPFAPSILREHVAEWFEQDDDVPFMMQVFQVRAGKRSLLPAVCHVDGSGRLQTVHRETNPRYHELISAFFHLTSVPMVLNTSFNENEPVVCRPEEALDCFLRTKMDVLVLGNWLIERVAVECGDSPPLSLAQPATVSAQLPHG